MRFCELRAKVGAHIDISESYHIAEKQLPDFLIIDQAMSRLEDIQKDLLRLYIQGYDYDEISEYKNMPVNTARVKIHRAKELIRKIK